MLLLRLLVAGALVALASCAGPTAESNPAVDPAHPQAEEAPFTPPRLPRAPADGGAP